MDYLQCFPRNQVQFDEERLWVKSIVFVKKLPRKIIEYVVSVFKDDCENPAKKYKTKMLLHYSEIDEYCTIRFRNYY